MINSTREKPLLSSFLFSFNSLNLFIGLTYPFPCFIWSGQVLYSCAALLNQGAQKQFSESVLHDGYPHRPFATVSFINSNNVSYSPDQALHMYMQLYCMHDVAIPYSCTYMRYPCLIYPCPEPSARGRPVSTSKSSSSSSFLCETSTHIMNGTPDFPKTGTYLYSRPRRIIHLLLRTAICKMHSRMPEYLSAFIYIHYT